MDADVVMALCLLALLQHHSQRWPMQQVATAMVSRCRVAKKRAPQKKQRKKTCVTPVVMDVQCTDEAMSGPILLLYAAADGGATAAGPPTCTAAQKKKQKKQKKQNGN